MFKSLIRSCLLVVMGFSPPLTSNAQDPNPVERKRSPVERMPQVRLKATHEDVLRIKASRRVLPPLPERTDFRTILHAHAEDSSHTGGTRPEMLAEAKKAGVHAIMLSDHYRPPKDFINESWRGLHEGVLFIPGSEMRGFLLYPTHSILSRMEAPLPDFIKAVTADDGLIFLSHIEERADHPMAGLDGLEIYNRHFDAKKDKAGLLSLILQLTDPEALAELQESLRLYPDEFFAFQVEPQTEYLAKWDRETTTRRLTGVAANDCHHNQILIVKMVDAETVLVGTNVDTNAQMRRVTALLRPGIRKLTEDHKPGDVVGRVDLDPYHRSFQNVSTHIFATELAETAIRSALREGFAYVSHDWICDPTGFRYELQRRSSPAVAMGGETKFTSDQKLVAQFPVACRIRLIRNGVQVSETTGADFTHAVDKPGVYRIEARLELDGELRGWIYSNPIYVR